jgi:predicted phosphodiesterase
MSVKSKIAREYCQRFPKHGDSTLAAKMYKENKLVFDSAEHARNSIRYVRGHAGAKQRKSLSDKGDMKPLTHNSNPYKLPESYAEPKEPFILPKAHNNILILSDTHIPYHSNEAIALALDYGKKNKINTVFLNGDIMDMYQLSRFEKDPRKRSVKAEFDATKEFLRVVRKTFPNAAFYFHLGNHDLRYEKWLMAKAPEIFDDPYYSLEERLRVNEERIIMIPNNQVTKMGKLFVHHGNLFFNGVFSPVNAARGLYTKAKASMICAHTHSVSEHTEKDVKGEITTCWSMGCLSDLQPDYSPYTNKYAHGFAHVIVQDNGNFITRNYRIDKGEIR